MRKCQVFIDKGALRQAGRIKLSGREQNLAVVAVKTVAVVINGDKIIVRADFLQLAKRVKEGFTIPEPHIFYSGAVVIDVCHGKDRFAGKIALLYLIQRKCLLCGFNIVFDKRGFLDELIRRNHKFLQEGRVNPTAQDRDEGIQTDSQDNEVVAGLKDVYDHQDSRGNRNKNKYIQERQHSVNVSESGAGKWSGRAVEQIGDSHGINFKAR